MKRPQFIGLAAATSAMGCASGLLVPLAPSWTRSRLRQTTSSSENNDVEEPETPTSSSFVESPYANELGAQPPLGFWDPLNFLYNAKPERFQRLRLVELKHGRVAMLAVVGHMATTAGLRVPGSEFYPAGLAALDNVPPEQLLTNIIAVGVLDFVVVQDKGKGEYPGDFRNGMFRWDVSPEEQRQKRAIELNNGRAAQMGILALMVHEKLTGEPYVINELLGFPTNFNAII